LDLLLGFWVNLLYTWAYLFDPQLYHSTQKIFSSRSKPTKHIPFMLTGKMWRCACVEASCYIESVFFDSKGRIPPLSWCLVFWKIHYDNADLSLFNTHPAHC
jgi:hypothetical protein